MSDFSCPSLNVYVKVRRKMGQIVTRGNRVYKNSSAARAFVSGRLLT
jgi:hypothetical protein